MVTGAGKEILISIPILRLEIFGRECDKNGRQVIAQFDSEKVYKEIYLQLSSETHAISIGKMLGHCFTTISHSSPAN